MNIFLPLTAHLLEIIISFSFIKNIFGIKRTFKIKFIPYLMAMIICITEYGLYIFFNNTAINILSFFVFNFLLALICFNSSVFNAIIASAFLSATLTAAEFSSLSVLSIGLKNVFDYYKESVSVFLLSTVISRFVFFILTKLCEYAGFYLRKGQNEKPPFFLFIYPITTIFVLYSYWIALTRYTMDKSISILIIVSSLFILISVFLTFVFYSKTSKKIAELYEEKNNVERIKTDTAYYSLLNKQNETLKMLTHDEKNHLLAIKAIANNPDVSAYIDKIYNEIKETTMFGNTDNKFLDLMLNKYQYECELNNIIFDYNIKTANLSFIESSDLISMMSNILDNAIEAAQKSSYKKIDLTINKSNNFDVLTCSNSCNQKPVSNGEELRTSKTKDGIHGYGIKSIKKVVKRYNGEMRWTYDEKEKVFTLKLVFSN